MIGADGRASRVAKIVQARSYQEKPRLQWSFYTYFSELPVDGFETYIRPFRGFGAAATNDGLTMLVLSWPYAEAHSYTADVEGNYYRTLELVPQFASRVKAARREAPFLGVPYRTTCGCRSVLVGRLSAMRAIARTRSPHRGSATPSATPNNVPRRLISG